MTPKAAGKTGGLFLWRSCGDGYYEVHGSRATVGFRYNFGNSTLQDENLKGATLKVFHDLTPIGDMRDFD